LPNSRRPSSVATRLNNLAFRLQAYDKSVNLYPLFQRALAITEKTQGPDHPEVAPILQNLGALAQSEGKYKQAEELYRRSLAILEKTLGPEHADVAYPLNNLGKLFLDQRKPALRIREKALGPEHPSTTMLLHQVTKLYILQKRFTEAEPLLLKTLAIRERTWQQSPAELKDCLSTYALLLRKTNREAEAKRMEDRVRTLVRSTPPAVMPADRRH